MAESHLEPRNANFYYYFYFWFAPIGGKHGFAFRGMAG